MNESCVSIITPCYNSQDYISDTILSVISQTYTNWELIIVDDYSTDKSVDIIKKYLANNKKIHLIKLTKKSGPAFARNEAIKVSNGRYLAFLDSDDYWSPNFLKASMENIKNHTFIYSCYNIVNKKKKLIDRSKIIPLVTQNVILRGTPISCLTAFIDIKKYGKKFFPLSAFREDLAYWMIILRDCKVAHGFNFCEANYRVHEKSTSANKIKMAFFTLKDYLKEYDLTLLKACYYFILYARNGCYKFVKKKIKILINNIYIG
jgi:teichuronic acid biosynthesis glycosyltransferase TuaG